MHTWQDIVLATGSLILAVALVPSLHSKDKPALLTSITTSSVLFVFAFAYATLSLWYAMVTTGFTAILWAILAVQKLIRS